MLLPAEDPPAATRAPDGCRALPAAEVFHSLHLQWCGLQWCRWYVSEYCSGLRDKGKLTALFEKYIQKLRITPAWDIRLEFVEDPSWPKTGDFKIDCDDRKAILLLNTGNPTQENLEEVIIHELMHIKMYPLDQVTESLITNCFEEGSAASKFAYQQFFTTLEQTVEELAKCFLLEFGENKEFSYGRCNKTKSFNDLYENLRNIE